MLVADKTLIAFAKRFFEEVYEKGQVEKLGEFCTTDVYVTGLPAPFTPDFAGLKQLTAMLPSAFSNQTWEVQEVIAEGDRMAVRWLTTSIHTGEFMGIPATGKKIAVTGMEFWHMRDGKIAEKLINMDLLGLMTQIGAFDK